MNIKQLEHIIFKPSSSIMRISGEKIFRDGAVSNIRGKKIENIYHVYSDVLDGISHEEFKTYMKINLQKKELEGVRCTCDDFKEVSKEKNLFMCEHLTATAYKFLNLLYKKQDKENELWRRPPEHEVKKIEVYIDVKVINKKWGDSTKFELEFRFGPNHKYLITDLKNFIVALSNRKSIFFNNQFTYNPNEHVLSADAAKIIDFIKEYTAAKGEISADGRNLAVNPNDLRGFLQCVGDGKVQLKYNGIEYKSGILSQDLPLSFTLKEKDDYFIITTHRRLPIPLNSNKDVYLFNSQLYLPTECQITGYGSLLSKFQKENEISYKKTMINYNAIISLLTNVSNDITITEGVRRFISDSLRFEFLLYKEEVSIYCNAEAVYYNKRFNILEDNRNKDLLIRDFYEEEKILMKLEKYMFVKRKDRLLFVGGDEEFFNLLNDRENCLSSLGTVTLGKGLGDTKVYGSSSIKIDLLEEDGYLNFNYKIGNVEKTELNNIYESYKANNRFYKTKDNSFIDFEDEGIKKFLNLIEVLNPNLSLIQDSISIEKSKALFITEALRNRDFKLNKGNNLLNDIENKLVNINNREIALPENLNAVLRQYQISGYEWLKNLSELGLSGILADEMGLGKTIQMIAFLVSEENKKSLIITPTSLIYNWKDEMERFAPVLKVKIAHGSGTNHEELINKLDEYDVILTTYGTLRNNIEKFNNIEFDYCIIDEAQNIKNPSAQITGVVKEIKSRIRFALTGTPIENNLMELWSIFDFAMPGYLYSKEAFDNKFVFKGESNLENLKLLIKPFILRRTKKEVINDLPDKIEKKIIIEMTAAQKLIYNAYIKDVREKIKNNQDGKIEVFSYLTKLRRICLDPSLVFEKYKDGSGKIKAAMDLIEEQIVSGGKILLFSQFTSALKKIGQSLAEKDIKYLYLDGSIRPKERIRLVNEFNVSEEERVFLISLKAGGTGLNLTSANLVIHFDPWWNPAVENQATDRAHRIGQRNVVEVIRLVSRGTIEEKIILLQEHKKELIDSVITGELKNVNLLNKLTREELMQLFDRI